MPRSRLIMRIAIVLPLLLSFPAALARNEGASALLSVVLGCAVIVFNKGFTQDAFDAQSRRSSREHDALRVTLTRIVSVVCGIGIVVWGVAILLGYEHIRGWN
jgi:hypothetical protein